MALISLDFIYKAIDRYNDSEDQRQARRMFEDYLLAEAKGEIQAKSQATALYREFLMGTVIGAFGEDSPFARFVRRTLNEISQE